MIFRILRDFILVYLGVVGVTFFYYEVNYSDVFTNMFKLLAVTLSVLIYCRGVIGVIHDIKNGALIAIWDKIKSFFGANQ